MRMDEDERWPDDMDLDRIRATPRGVFGGWLVVGAIMALMLAVPPAVSTADIAVAHAKQNVEKVEHRLARTFGWPGERIHRC